MRRSAIPTLLATKAREDAARERIAEKDERVRANAALAKSLEGRFPGLGLTPEAMESPYASSMLSSMLSSRVAREDSERDRIEGEERKKKADDDEMGAIYKQMEAEGRVPKDASGKPISGFTSLFTARAAYNAANRPGKDGKPPLLTEEGRARVISSLRAAGDSDPALDDLPDSALISRSQATAGRARTEPDRDLSQVNKEIAETEKAAKMSFDEMKALLVAGEDIEILQQKVRDAQARLPALYAERDKMTGRSGGASPGPNGASESSLLDRLRGVLKK